MGGRLLTMMVSSYTKPNFNILLLNDKCKHKNIDKKLRNKTEMINEFTLQNLCNNFGKL